MARSLAPNLTGLLSSISGTLGKMGQAGDPYVDGFRRFMAPDVDMEDSASLANYSQWARRNGYKDEASQYERMALYQKQNEKTEAEKQAKSAAQLAISRNLSQAQQIATSTSLPAAERERRIRELSTEAQQMAAEANLDPRTVLTPVNQLLNYVSTQETAGQAASIQADAGALQKEIANAIATNDTARAQNLLNEYNGVIARAEAHGNADLIKDINTGLTTLIGKIPDSQQRVRDSNVARAIELSKTGGSEKEISRLLAEPLARDQFNRRLAEIEAEELQRQKDQASLAASEAALAERNANANDRAQKGEKLNRDFDLKYLSEDQWVQYKTQFENASESLAARIAHNERYRSINAKNEAEAKDRLSNEAIAYVARTPNMIAEMDTSWNLGYDLEAWAKNTSHPDGVADWREQAKIIAGLVAQNPDFIEGTVEEKQKIALDETIKHMKGVSKKFAEAYASNEKDRKRREANAAIISEEQASDWEVLEGGISTDPDSNATFVESKYKEYAEGQRQDGERVISYDDWLEKQWKRIFHKPTKNIINSLRKSEGFPILDPLEENYQGFQQSLENRLGNRTPAPATGPSIVERQRSKLSPPMGPLGDPDDYVTKLRQAREKQPNPIYPGLPPMADPYIDPRYRKLGGG